METLEAESPAAPKLPAYVVVRRSRLVAVVVALVLVVGAVLLVDRVVYSYQPLSFDAGGAQGGFLTARGTLDAPEYRGATLYRFDRGGVMQFGATLTNLGSRPVRVTEFPRFDHAYMQPGVIDVMPTNALDGMTGPWSAFEPFTLGGGETKQVRFTWDFPDCDLDFVEGMWNSFSTQEVRYEVLGVDRKAVLDLPSVLTPEGASGSCDP